MRFRIIPLLESTKPSVEDLKKAADQAQDEWDSWYDSHWKPLVHQRDRGTPSQKKAALAKMRELQDELDAKSDAARNTQDRWVRRVNAQERLDAYKKHRGPDTQLDLFNEDAQVIQFKPKKRFLRHLIEVVHFPGRDLPYAMFIYGIHFNSYKTREEAEKKALEKENELDRSYSSPSGWNRTRIVNIGRDWYVLDKGVVVGVYTSKEIAIKKADEINPKLPNMPKHDHWID
jgi:hypothetical protein